jgi:rod shape determining protein RodA
VFALPDSMQVLKPHQQQRIVALVSQIQGDSRYENGIGYQQSKAMTLAGSGGWSGYGAARSETIVRYNKLPEDHNDMIFAVIVNRWGWVGGMATLGLYLVIVLSMLAVALMTKDAFTQISAVGFAGLIFSQAMINIAITLGLVPVTGITLPFVSYGGSSLVAMFAVIGLVLNFASRRPMILARPSFEFDRADAAFS